jgi:hypothetical protein
MIVCRGIPFTDNIAEKPHFVIGQTTRTQLEMIERIKAGAFAQRAKLLGQKIPKSRSRRQMIRFVAPAPAPPFGFENW